MKKITFNTLPEAISELIFRIEKIEKILSRETTKSAVKSSGKKRSAKSQVVPAGMLSITEASKLLKMSVINLYSYVKNKKIPFIKRGRRLFFSKSVLENWMKVRNQQINSADNITIKEAEKLLKVPATTIYYKIRSQKLKPVLRRGNKLYFSKKELINAFTKPVKRTKKSLKAGKKAKAKSTVTSKTTKTARAGKEAKAKKIAKTARRGRPAKTAVAPKPEGSAAKPAQPVKATKEAPVKTAKPAKAKTKKAAPAKAPKPAPAKAPKPAPEKAAKIAKPKKTKSAKPAVKPVKPVPAAPSPVTEPVKQPEKAPESQVSPNTNQQPENGGKE